MLQYEQRITEQQKSYTTSMLQLEQRVCQYWSRRANKFRDVRHQELKSMKAALWKKEILPYLPQSEQKAPLRILDVGTGAGFFAILLAQEGHEVIGIDLCTAMLQEAKALAQEEHCSIGFYEMSATDLRFADNSFDAVIARNVLWTLTNPEQAYREWYRVLRPNGVLLNFDADYGTVNFTHLATAQGEHAHSDIAPNLLREGEEIRQALPLTTARRPLWDLDLLWNIGFFQCSCDNSLSERIFKDKDATYNPVPMFAIRAVKETI